MKDSRREIIQVAVPRNSSYFCGFLVVTAILYTNIHEFSAACSITSLPASTMSDAFSPVVEAFRSPVNTLPSNPFEDMDEILGRELPWQFQDTKRDSFNKNTHI